MSNLLTLIEIMSSSSDTNTLYHYNTKKLSTLYSLAKQTELGVDIRKDPAAIANKNRRSIFQRDPFPYDQHVSFFLDPIPLKLVRKYFTDNKVYQNFDHIYEHRVDIQQLKDNLNYWKLVENPISNFMVDLYPTINFPGKNLLYFGTKNIINDLAGYQGTDFDKLLNCISKFKGSTEREFRRLVKDGLKDYYKAMYAPTVPHLLIYPINGQLEISSVVKKNFK